MTIGRNRVSLVRDAVTIQWATGKNEGRLTPGMGRFISHVGFYTEVGKDREFDEAMEAAGISQMEMRHQNPSRIVPHWNLGERLRLYVLTSGPVGATVAASLSRRNIQATAEAGIGVRWGRGEGERSKLAVRALMQLYDADGQPGYIYPRLVQLSVRSRMTDEVLAALVDHVRVCEIADNVIDRTNHPEVIQCHELALPLGAGREEQWGKGETTTVFPIASQHPANVDRAYLRTLWRSPFVDDTARSEWPAVQAWAQDFCFGERGGNGNGNGYED